MPQDFPQSPVKDAAKLSSAEILENERTQRRLTAEIIKKDLPQKDGISSFAAPIKIKENSFDSSIVFNKDGSYIVSMQSKIPIENGNTSEQSMIFKFSSSSELIGKEGRRYTNLIALKAEDKLIREEMEFNPGLEYADAAITQLKMAKNQNILPRAK